MVLHPLCTLPAQAFPKPYLQIRAGAENPPVARHYHALYFWIDVEHGIRGLDLAAHGFSEGIVLSRAVQRQHDDAGLCFVVGGADAGPLAVEVVVAVWEGDVGHVAGGDLTG